MTAPRNASLGRVLPRATAVLLAAVALGMGLASPALAHDGLAGSSPASASTVATAPASVELEFTGEPLPLGTLVAVTGPDGATVSDGPAEIRGTTVVQPLTGELPAGAYRVDWRSTSSDGHALSGTFDYTVTAGAAPAADGRAVSPASAVTTGDDGPAIAPVWLGAGAVVLLGLGGALVTRVRRRA